MNQAITLSGQDDLNPDEIDFPSDSFFYIGGEAPAGKVLATDMDGHLYYANNDFNSNNIHNDGSTITQQITCYPQEIEVLGHFDFLSTEPMTIEGSYENDTFLGVKNDKMGWYENNVTPYKIELDDGAGAILTKVECNNSDIIFDGDCHFFNDTPFQIKLDVGTPNKVLGIDSTGIMKWLSVENPLIPIDADLDINSLIVEGLIPNIPSYGVVIKNGLRVDGLASFKGVLGVVIDNNLRVDGLANFKGAGGVVVDEILLVYKNIDCRASLQLHDNIYLTATSNISIDGDVGSEKQVLSKDDDNNLKWMDLPPPEAHGLTAGLNIDSAELSSGVIATNHDLIELENIKMNAGTPRFYIGSDFGSRANPVVLGCKPNSGILEWLNITGPSHLNPIFRSGVNINPIDFLDGQISVDYFPTMAGIHLNGSGAGYNGAVLELNNVIGIRQGKIQCSPIDSLYTTPITEWVEPIVNVFWVATANGLRIDLNSINDAKSATDIVVANTMTTEDAGSEFHFLSSSNPVNGMRFLKQNITFPVGVVSPLILYSNYTLIRTFPFDNAKLVGSLNIIVGGQGTADNTACIELLPHLNIIGFHIGSGLNIHGIATGETIPVSTMDIQLIYSGVVDGGRNVIYCNATIYARLGYLRDYQSWSSLLYAT